MRVLVICDDYWHPARVVRGGLAPLAGSGYQFDWIEDAADWSAERMDEYPLVIFCKSDNISQANRDSWVTEEVQRAFVSYIRKGRGLLAIHSGTVYRDKPVMRALLGGAFTHHPPQCPVTVELKEGHILTAGSTPFTVTDEHYHMGLDDAQADLFMTTRSEHSTQPGGWTRTEGDGRVCVLTPGHNVEVWLHPSFQALLLNALSWCAKTL